MTHFKERLSGGFSPQIRGKWVGLFLQTAFEGNTATSNELECLYVLIFPLLLLSFICQLRHFLCVRVFDHGALSFYLAFYRVLCLSWYKTALRLFSIRQVHSTQNGRGTFCFVFSCSQAKRPQPRLKTRDCSMSVLLGTYQTADHRSVPGKCKNPYARDYQITTFILLMSL